MKDKKQQIFWFLYGFLATLCILIFVIYYSSFFVHAESYFPMGQDDNSLFSETALNYINSHYDSENNYIFARSYGTLSGGRPAYCVFYWSKNSDTMYYSELLSNGYQFSLYKSGSANPTMKYFYVNNGTCTEYTWTQANWNQNFQNQNSSLYNSSISFVSNFQVYTNSNKEKVVLKYGESPFQPAEGHATPTDFNNNDNLINYDPRQPSTPTFPTFPTITLDTTNVESLLESIFDVLDSIGDYVGECFSVFFSWVVEVMQNGIQSVINTIRDFADNVYANMVSLFEPIAQNIQYLVEPIDSELIEFSIEETNFYGVVSQYTTFFTTFENYINSVSESSEFIIPIHLENLSYFHLSTYYLNLGSHFLPIRSALRTFLWVLVSVGSVFVVERGLSDWLRGENDT